MTQPGETEFSRVLADWQATNAIGVSNIGEWERALEAIARDEQGLRERGAWVHGRDDLFGVLGIQRAEVRHSAMIAWLMDPCARHGLGTRFLASVLRRAFPNDAFAHLAGARTICEVTRGECRADIVIGMTDATIILENKVDAEESPRQCDVLYERFSEDRGARFILLTPLGNRPDTATGDAAEAFASISYGDVRTALREALGATPENHAPWGRRTAEDYLLTLGREFR
jgi:hypothetical protein